MMASVHAKGARPREARTVLIAARNSKKWIALTTVIWAATGSSVNVNAVRVRVTVRVLVVRLLPASRAVTDRVFNPDCKVIIPVVQVVVPLATPLPPRSFAHVT